MLILIGNIIAHFQNLIRKIKIAFLMLLNELNVRKIYLNLESKQSSFSYSDLIEDYQGFREFISSVYLVIQGPELNKGLYLQIKKLFSYENVIWIDSDSQNKVLKKEEKCFNLNIKKLKITKNQSSLNKYSPQNLHIQCLSTTEGLNLNKSKVFALKIRSDINFDLFNFLLICYVNSLSSKAFTISSFNSYTKPNYSLSDMVVFGEFDKIKSLFLRPIQDENIFLYSKGFSPEQIIFGLDALSKMNYGNEYFKDFIKNDHHYKKYLKENIKIVNSYLTGFYFPRKYNRDFNSTRSLSDTFIAASGKKKKYLTEEIRKIISHT